MKQLRDTKVDWPVALDELEARMIQCSQAQMKMGLLAPLPFIGFVLISYPLVGWIDSNQASLWFCVIWVFALFAILSLSIIFYIRAMIRQIKLFGLVCPSCEVNMGGVDLRSVVALGKCRKCGAQLVANHSIKAEQGGAE